VNAMADETTGSRAWLLVRRHSRARSPTPAAGAGTLDIVAADISYGPGTPSDDELRLCGDITDGKRAVELGISDSFNSVAFAQAGAKSIAVDPDTEKIALTRQRATEREVHVQCLETDLADLGDVASASCDLVLAVHSIDHVDDLGRLLRQVHRILKPSLPLVMAMPTRSPTSPTTSLRCTGARTISAWFTALTRTNFRVDQVIELGARRFTGTHHAHPPGPQGRFLSNTSPSATVSRRRVPRR
jgi:SAM-dependent methyltransferase